VTVVTTVVTGLMNQLTAVSDSFIKLAVVLKYKDRRTNGNKHAEYIEKLLSTPWEHAPLTLCLAK